MGRNDAKIWLRSSDTWLTDTPNAAGTISSSTRRSPGCERSKRQRGSKPSLARNGTWQASCSAPPTNTAQASTSTGGSKRSAKNSAPTMNATLSSAGVIAGTEKRFQVFRMPAESDTSEMKTMYGKVMRSSCTVMANFSGSLAKPGAVR